MRKILTFIFISCSLMTYSQWDGTFNTKYGTIKLIQEPGTKNNDYQTIIYGDYGDNGTIIAKINGSTKEIAGTFHNGRDIGSFIWRNTALGNNPSTLTNFSGNWGFGTQNNNNSGNPDHIWTGTKTNTLRPSDLKNAVWTGIWNTSFGEVILEQIGTKVTGKYYHNNKIGSMDANYNIHSKILTGTYLENGRSGSFQFNMSADGNSFTGKWGWGTVMNELSPWDGTKKIKTNRSIGNSQANSSVNNSTNNIVINTNNLSQSNTSERTKLTVSFDRIKTDLGTKDFYGIWGVKVFRLTNGSRTTVASFGNKSDVVYNQSRNSSRIILVDNTNLGVEHKREYILDNRDLQNPNVKFEIEIIVDPKSKAHKASDDIHYGRKKVVFEIDKIEHKKKQETLYFRVLNPVNANLFEGVTYYFTIETSTHL